MQKFYTSQKTIRGALDLLGEKKIKGFRFLYDDETYNQILQKLGLEEVYGKNKVNIIDYNARISPLTYYLNTKLKPIHHLIYPDGQSSQKFWERIQKTETEMANFHVLKNSVSSTVKANLLTKPLEQKLIEPRFTEEPVNDSLLFVGDFMSTTQASALRTCIYSNEVRTSIFRYGGVKFLAWTTPMEVLKYLGPLGSLHRRTNSMMANLYSDIRVIACSEQLKNAKAQRLLGGMDYVPLPYNDYEGEVCLVELQSNHRKYKIDHQDELHLIIHKLFCTPGALIREKLHVLGPGAEDYFVDIIPEEVLNKKVSMVTNEEWVALSNDYYYWPFKPDTRLETYATADSYFDDV